MLWFLFNFLVLQHTICIPRTAQVLFFLYHLPFAIHHHGIYLSPHLHKPALAFTFRRSRKALHLGWVRLSLPNASSYDVCMYVEPTLVCVPICALSLFSALWVLFILRHWAICLIPHQHWENLKKERSNEGKRKEEN